jgi:hypothetical protein
MLRVASRFAWISLGANLFWCLAMYLPSRTVVHQGSYLTIVLMYFAAGCVATEWFPLYLVVLVAQTCLFAAAWFPKVAFTNIATPSGACAVFVLLGVAGVSLACAWKPLSSELRRQWHNLSTRGARSRLTANAPELLTIGLIATVFLAVALLTHDFATLGTASIRAGG